VGTIQKLTLPIVTVAAVAPPMVGGSAAPAPDAKDSENVGAAVPVPTPGAKPDSK